MCNHFPILVTNLINRTNRQTQGANSCWCHSGWNRCAWRVLFGILKPLPGFMILFLLDVFEILRFGFDFHFLFRQYFGIAICVSAVRKWCSVCKQMHSRALAMDMKSSHGLLLLHYFGATKGRLPPPWGESTRIASLRQFSPNRNSHHAWRLEPRSIWVEKLWQQTMCKQCCWIEWRWRLPANGEIACRGTCSCSNLFGFYHASILSSFGRLLNFVQDPSPRIPMMHGKQQEM